MHISNIYADGELEKEGTYKKFLLVRQEGKRQVHRNMDHYNLDMINHQAVLCYGAEQIGDKEIKSQLSL